MINKTFLLAFTALFCLVGCDSYDNVRFLNAIERRMLISNDPKVYELFEIPNDNYDYIVRDTNGVVWYYKYPNVGTNFHKFIIFHAR